MGIAIGALHFLLEEGVRSPWSGQALTLGRQQIAVTREQFFLTARDVGYVPRSSEGTGSARDVLTDRELFALLGFDQLRALDASTYEAPDIVYDLNTSDIPSELEGGFDLVFDGGTLEHVFDVACALRNVCRLTSRGGRVIHLSPLSNCVDHGFYSFSPILFLDFYAANNWIVRRIAVARFDSDPAHDPWTIYDYRSEDFGRLGALSAGTYFLLTCVQSTAESTFDVVPQQSYYKEVWSASAPAYQGRGR